MLCESEKQILYNRIEVRNYFMWDKVEHYIINVIGYYRVNKAGSKIAY